MAESKENRQKAKSKGFAELGVPIGAVIAFRRDPLITATVVDGKNKVEYQGRVYPVSGLAKELMGTPASGYHAFKYNGVLLAKLGGPVKESEYRAELSVKPAGEAPVASDLAESPKPLTIPLPRPQEAATEPPEAFPEETVLADFPAEDDTGSIAVFDPLGDIPPDSTAEFE
jgi:hypothetical protein